MTHQPPLIFLRALRRTSWHPGSPVRRQYRSRRGITIAPYWQVIATEAACQCFPADSLLMVLAEHDLASGVDGSGKRGRPRMTHHSTEGIRCCILSQTGNSVVRIALESERRAVLREMRRSSASPLDKKSGRRYSQSRIIVKPQRRKSGTPK